MYRPNSLQTFPQNVPYQHSQMNNRPDLPRPFQQQQFGPRFQTPSQQFTPPRPFYQPVQQHHDGPRLPYQGSLPPHTHYQPTNSSFDCSIPQPQFQPPAQNYETVPNSQYPPPLSVGPGFNQPSSPFTAPIQNYNQPPPIQNFNQPPPIQNFNQPPPVQNYCQPPPVQNFSQPPPVQTYNSHPPIHHFNQPPPVQNYNQLPVSPSFKALEPTGNQSMCSPHQSPSSGFGQTPNVQYQPQIHSAEPLKQSFGLSGSEFNQRPPPFRTPGQHQFPFGNNQHPRYQRPQLGNNRVQFHPRQQYQNKFRPRGSFPCTNNNYPPNGNIVPKKDKIQIACEMDDCDFVGHAGAIREHQNLHHRLGLHKKVLYSNNSDAVKNWIQDRKKKWPTKETIQLKIEVEEEKNKRGERIADEDFQRFNKNSKLNNSGSKRSNNRKRQKFNDKFVEPIEKLMNGNLKRFAGIVEAQKKIDNDESSKLVASKLLVEYDESSDDEPPEETSIVKECAAREKTSTEPNKELRSPISNTSVLLERNEVVNTTTVSTENDDSRVVDEKVEIDSSSKVNSLHEKTNAEQRGRKRKKSANKEFKQIKKPPPLRTPRTEIVERKNALVEALMGDLMRSERNTVTQCICYIRNNMHRFGKMQAA